MKSKKLVAVCIAGVMVCGSALAGFAALPAGQMAINAILNLDKKISYLGQAVKDSKGNTLNAITYNGIEYLPVTALEKAGVSINKGEGTDKTIYLGTTGKELLLNSPKFIDSSKDEFTTFTKAQQDLYLEGKTYKYGYNSSKKYQTDDLDVMENSGGFYPIIQLDASSTKIIPTEFEASFYIDEEAEMRKYPFRSGDIVEGFKVIVVSIDEYGETVIASEEIVPGKVTHMKIPCSSQKIGFRIGTSSKETQVSYSNLNLTILEPKFIK